MIVVYDVTGGETFANVKRWLHEIEQNCDVVNRILGMLRYFNYCKVVIQLFKAINHLIDMFVELSWQQE